MDEHSEKVNKELENMKKNQTELKNTIAEIKNTLEGIQEYTIYQMIQRNRSVNWKTEQGKLHKLKRKKERRIFFFNEDS